MENFEYVWRWKIKVESMNKAHILEDRYKDETYRRLSIILPRWQTYRNGDNLNPLRTLEDSIANILEAYSQLRTFTLLDFDKIPFEILEIIWHELEVLGFGVDEIDRILDYLYPALANEIKQPENTNARIKIYSIYTHTF